MFVEGTITASVSLGFSVIQTTATTDCISLFPKKIQSVAFFGWNAHGILEQSRTDRSRRAKVSSKSVKSPLKTLSQACLHL